MLARVYYVQYMPHFGPDLLTLASAHTYSLSLASDHGLTDCSLNRKVIAGERQAFLEHKEGRLLGDEAHVYADGGGERGDCCVCHGKG